MPTSETAIESLLTEMVDRDSVARFPQHDFRLKQHSSYNRASKDPADAKGWFNNKDNNTSEKDKNFIRIEENDGQKEWVLMDHEGAGAIVRTWMPFRNAGNPNTDTLRGFRYLRLDNNCSPCRKTLVCCRRYCSTANPFRLRL